MTPFEIAISVTGAILAVFQVIQIIQQMAAAKDRSEQKLLTMKVAVSVDGTLAAAIATASELAFLKGKLAGLDDAAARQVAEKAAELLKSATAARSAS
jgi:hypothetical protein